MNADQQRKANEVQTKLRKGLIQAVAVLESDVKYAGEQWRKCQAPQFWCRTLLRCCCASVEGTISLLKQITPSCADFFCVSLTDSDMKVVTERRTYVDEAGVTKTKPAFLPFRDNVKETFKVFSKAHSVQASVNYEDSRFADLCETFDLRNRLMHPKTVYDLEVSDKATDAADRGFKWFKESLVRLLEDCGNKLPSQPKTS